MWWSAVLVWCLLYTFHSNFSSWQCLNWQVSAVTEKHTQVSYIILLWICVGLPPASVGVVCLGVVLSVCPFLNLTDRGWPPGHIKAALCICTAFVAVTFNTSLVHETIHVRFSCSGCRRVPCPWIVAWWDTLEEGANVCFGIKDHDVFFQWVSSLHSESRRTGMFV